MTGSLVFWQKTKNAVERAKGFRCNKGSDSLQRHLDIGKILNNIGFQNHAEQLKKEITKSASATSVEGDDFIFLLILCDYFVGLLLINLLRAQILFMGKCTSHSYVNKFMCFIAKKIFISEL